METLQQIEMLLRIYYSGWEFGEVYLGESGDEMKLTASWLVENGYAEQDGLDYRATEKGAVFCEAVRKVPAPVQKWVMEDFR